MFTYVELQDPPETGYEMLWGLTTVLVDEPMGICLAHDPVRGNFAPDAGSCSLPAQHAGPHRDQRGVEWLGCTCATEIWPELVQELGYCWHDQRFQVEGEIGYWRAL